MNSKNFFLCTTVVLLAVGFAPLAFGLTYSLDTVASGSTPAGTSPWLTVDIVQTGTDRVSLTMSAVNLTAGSTQFTTNWFFNVQSAEVVLDQASLNPTEMTQLKGFVFGPDLVSSGDGLVSGFDIGFNFNTPASGTGTSPFGAGELFSADLLGIGLTPESFFLTNSDGTLFTAAEIQGIGGIGSGWIAAANASTPVAEPATMLMLGIGLTGLAFFGRKKFLN